VQVGNLGYESTEIKEFGMTEVRHLIPDGRNHMVRVRLKTLNRTILTFFSLICMLFT
jgi:hypothetical protein